MAKSKQQVSSKVNKMRLALFATNTLYYLGLKTQWGFPKTEVCEGNFGLSPSQPCNWFVLILHPKLQAEICLLLVAYLYRKARVIRVCLHMYGLVA